VKENSIGRGIARLQTYNIDVDVQRAVKDAARKQSASTRSRLTADSAPLNAARWQFIEYDTDRRFLRLKTIPVKIPPVIADRVIQNRLFIFFLCNHGTLFSFVNVPYLSSLLSPSHSAQRRIEPVSHAGSTD